MSTEIVSLLAIVVIAIGAYAIYYLYSSAQKRKNEALSSPKKFEAWMTAQGFSPDDFSFFHGTGIAIKQGDDRMAVYLSGAGAFHPIAQIASVKAYRAVENVRPLGAAPGVVEHRDILRFHIDIELRQSGTPLKIMLENPSLMQEWEQRLKARLS